MDAMEHIVKIINICIRLYYDRKKKLEYIFCVQ